MIKTNTKKNNYLVTGVLIHFAQRLWWESEHQN